jgi:putative transposase
VGEKDVADGKKTATDQGAWIVFEDESGQSIKPSKGRTWSVKGHTPVVTVTGKRSGRVCLAGAIAIKPDVRTRMIYRMIIRRGRRGEKKGFTSTDLFALADAAHAQLGGPIVLVWDNSSTHISAMMRRRIAARDWVTVFQLPSYAPELNPTEGMWAHTKKSLTNLAPCSTDQLAGIVKGRLTRLQYRSELLDGFIAHTGLSLSL